MKKYFVFFLITLQLIAFAGCSIPYGDAGKDPSSAVSAGEGEVTDKSTTDGAVTSGNTEEVTSTAASTGKDNVQTSADPRVGRIPVALYYQDADGFLIPVTRWIEKQQGIAKAALAGLVDSAMTREELQYYGLYPVIPLDTDILGISINKEGIATVDFDKKLLNFADKSGEKNMLASVVYTLTGFKTINGVKIRINGFEQKELKNGTDISGVFSRDRIMMNSSELPGSPDSYKTELFVLKKANDIYTYVAPVSVVLKGDLASHSPEKILNLLIQQKADKGIYNEIPQKTRVLSTVLKNGILTVDFSKELQEYGGNAKEEAILKQILYTAGQIKDVSKVKILIEGQTAELPEGTELTAPMNVPTVINDVIDNS